MPGGLARRPPQRSDKDEQVTGALYLEAMIGHWIRLVAIGVEIFGVLIIVAGIVWSCWNVTPDQRGRLGTAFF